MKILLLSVLAVAMIGLMIPSAFAESKMSDFKLKIDDIAPYDSVMADTWMLENEWNFLADPGIHDIAVIEGAIRPLTQVFHGYGELDRVILHVEFIEFENSNFAKKFFREFEGEVTDEFSECKSTDSYYGKGKWIEKQHCRIGNFSVNFATDFQWDYPGNAKRSFDFSIDDVSSKFIDSRYEIISKQTTTEVSKQEDDSSIKENYWWSSCSDTPPELDSLSRPILPYSFDIFMHKNTEYLSLTDNNLMSGKVIPKNYLTKSYPCVELNLFLREYASNCSSIDATPGLSPSNSAPVCGGGGLIWTDYYLKSTTVQDDLSFSFIIEPSEIEKWKYHPKVKFIVSPANSVTHNNEYGSEPITIKFGEFSLPSWIKNNAGWWAEGTLTDFSFVQSIQYLIDKGIIAISEMESTVSTEKTIPAWIKNNAGWWAEGQIDDKSFVQGIEYLVKVGIIQVS
jgi:hypothetical protein